MKVHSVVSGLTAHTSGLSVVLANGSMSPAAEAAQLSGSEPLAPLLSLLPAVARLSAPTDPQRPGAAAADIAVLTPGRLVHHLETFGPLWRQSLEVVVRSPRLHAAAATTLPAVPAAAVQQHLLQPEPPPDPVGPCPLPGWWCLAPQIRRDLASR